MGKVTRKPRAADGERLLEVGGHSVILKWSMASYDALFTAFETDIWQDWYRLILGGKPQNLNIAGEALTAEGNWAELWNAVQSPADIAALKDALSNTSMGLPVDPKEEGEGDEPGKPEAGENL